jgi:phage minor structural protein
MLTIYDRQKNKVGGLQTFGYFQEVAKVAINRRLNSDYTLTFNFAMESPKYSLLEKEGLIECEGQKYIIKEFERKREGMGRTVQVKCPHIMQRMRDIKIPYSSAVSESLGADISTMLNIISSATGGVFTFQVMDVIPVKDVYKWGFSNCLKAFQDLVKLYDVEFVPDNYNIKIYNKININNGMQYRFAKNIISNSFKDNTNTLCTRMTGLAKDSLTIIDMPASHLTTDEQSRLSAIPGAIVGGIVKVPYLISQYASTWSTPDNTFFDSEFEATDIDASTEAGKVLLLAEIRKKLAASEIPDIQIQIEAADLWKIYDGQRPQLGETVTLIDTDMEMNNITARVMELTEYPFDPQERTPVTLANYLLKDMRDEISDLNTTKGIIDGLLTNKNLNTSAFEAFAKAAINDINNSKSQVIYDQRGIVLQEVANAAHQVIMTANGIVITTDGGTTASTAITASGIAAQYIVGVLGNFAQVKTDNLIAGTAKIGSALIDTIKANQIDVTSGKIIAAQIDATNLHVSSANIDGLLTAAQINTTGLQAESVKSTWVYAGTLNASQINAGQIAAAYINTSGLSAEKIYQAGTPSSYMVVGGTYGDLVLYQSNAEYFRISNNIGGISFRYGGTGFLTSSGSTTNPIGTWNFTNATVTNLNVTAKFA